MSLFSCSDIRFIQDWNRSFYGSGFYQKGRMEAVVILMPPSYITCWGDTGLCISSRAKLLLEHTLCLFTSKHMNMCLYLDVLDATFPEGLKVYLCLVSWYVVCIYSCVDCLA